MEARAKTGSSVGKGFALLVPFLLFFAGVFFLSMYLYQSVLEETAYFGLIVGERAPEESMDAPDADDGFTPVPGATKLDHTPSVAYGKRFARLNVDGWSIRNIPVYLGSDKKILKNGAGMSFGSRFPGEGGCTIISAHVTRDFAELENTMAGTTVLLETTYGTYRYRVSSQAVFDGTDRRYMNAAQNADLVLYTCYPFENGGKRRTQRCVLYCNLINDAEVGG